MKQKIVEIMFDPRSTERERLVRLREVIEDIEKRGDRIISSKPIEQVIVNIIGRKFVVESSD